MQPRGLLVTILAIAALCLAAPAAEAYDMLDYMLHDNTRKANVLLTHDGQAQQIRSYCPSGSGGACSGSSNRFYITKNWNGAGATDFEEYEYDSSWIYLVRDTSWQPSNWCSGKNTMFELWTNGVKRGQRFPRNVVSGGTYWTNQFEIRSRREDTCRVCDGPSDSDFNQNQANKFRFTWLYSKYFSSTGKTVYDVMRVEILEGPGAAKHEVYYYSKGLGFVGYKDDDAHSYYSGPANGGNDFEVAALDPCDGAGCGYGASGWNWYTSVGDFYHQIGRQDGYDWSASTWWDPPGFLSYGPYTTAYGSGRHTVWHLLWIDNNTANNDVVLTLDVVGRAGKMLLARREIRRREFGSANAWHWFTLDFNDPCFENIETRIWWHDRAFIKHGQTYIYR